MRPGQKTLTALIATVRSRADIERSGHITDAEITDWLNTSHGELYDELVTSLGGYFEASKEYTSDGTNILACPSDFLKSDTLDLEISAGADGQRSTLKRIAWGDRNKYRWPTATTWPSYYCLRGENIYLFPTPAAGAKFTLWYVPRMPALANSGTIQVLTEAATGDAVTINGVRFALPAGMQAVDSLRASIALACADPTSALYGLSVALDTRTLTLTCARPSKVVLSSISPTFYAPIEQWQSYLDGFNGWEEIAILDVVIKCRLKAEEDPSAEVALREKKRASLQEAAANRDQGGPCAPTRTWDPYNNPGGWPFGPFGFGRW